MRDKAFKTIVDRISGKVKRVKRNIGGRQIHHHFLARVKPGLVQSHYLSSYKSVLPFSICKHFVHTFLYAGVYSRTLEKLTKDKEFMFQLYRGLKPRQYDAEDPQDSTIVEED